MFATIFTFVAGAVVGFVVCFFVVRNNPKLDAQANKVA